MGETIIILPCFALSFIIMSLQWSATNVSLDIKHKMVSLWFKGEHTEALADRLLASKTSVERHIEQCLQCEMLKINVYTETSVENKSV